MAKFNKSQHNTIGRIARLYKVDVVVILRNIEPFEDLFELYKKTTIAAKQPTKYVLSNRLVQMIIEALGEP